MVEEDSLPRYLDGLEIADEGLRALGEGFEGRAEGVGVLVEGGHARRRLRFRHLLHGHALGLSEETGPTRIFI